jgi:hypothetical protein
MHLSSALATGLAAAALLASPALAQQTTQQDYRTAWSQWQQANNETVSADRIMRGDVTNGFNMLGTIDDLILNEQGNRIEYVLYEVPQSYLLYGNDDGFVRWDNVALERGYGAGVDVRIDDDAEAGAKEELTITRREAGSRMVSRIVGSEMMFAGGTMREIEDILFDPESGMITHFVVELDEDSLFDSDTRRIPATMVNMDAQGRWMAAQPVTYDWEIWVF